MIPDTEKPRSNRAATPLFRVFGGRFRPPSGDARRISDREGLHRGEWRLLAILVPLVVGTAIYDLLVRTAGPTTAWIGVLPGTFVVLHLLTFILGGGTPRAQFHRWSAVLSFWALAQLLWFPGSGVAWAAWLWLGMMALQLLAATVLGWRALMAVPGSAGLRIRVGIALAAHVLMAAAWILAGWQVGVAIGCLIAAVWCRGTLSPISRLYGPVASRVMGEQPLLTFDDGPHPNNTPAILDLLDAHGRKAVFFVIGENVRRFPELTREIVRRGHELGNHTMTHPQASMWRLGPSATRREIGECNRVIEEVAGVKPRWFRAPVGHRNYFTHPITADLGLEVVAWSRRAFDTIDSDPSRVIQCLSSEVKPGDILLIHDTTDIAVQVTKGVLENLGPVATGGSDVHFR